MAIGETLTPEEQAERIYRQAIYNVRAKDLPMTFTNFLYEIYQELKELENYVPRDYLARTIRELIIRIYERWVW